MKAPSIFRRSLAARLALIFGLISLLVVVSMGLGIYGLTSRFLQSRAQDDLTSLADFYAVYTASSAADESRLAVLAPQIASFFAPQAGYDVRLFSARTGGLLAATRYLLGRPFSYCDAHLSTSAPYRRLNGLSRRSAKTRRSRRLRPAPARAPRPPASGWWPRRCAPWRARPPWRRRRN